MSIVGWIVFLVVVLPVVGFLLFLLVVNSRVVIPPGSLGLVLVRGRATDVVLPPGTHWVAALRRRQVVEYPSVDLAYRAGDTTVTDTPAGDGTSRDATAGDTTLRDSAARLTNRARHDLQRSGPPLPVVLGDRATASLRYTVRFRLDKDGLPTFHERVGPDGLWSLVRDMSEREVATVLLGPDTGVGEVFGEARVELARRLADACREAFKAEGLHLSAFHLVEVDLAGTGATIQDTVRTRYDAELAVAVADLPMDAVRRYQEVELWRRLAARESGLSVVLPIGNARHPDRVPDDPAEADRP